MTMMMTMILFKAFVNVVHDSFLGKKAKRDDQQTTRALYCAQVIRLKNIPTKEQVACRNEVEMLRRMCHPNIVGYTNSLIYKNCLCIIMEYCDAGDLGDRVNEAKASKALSLEGKTIVLRPFFAWSYIFLC